MVRKLIIVVTILVVSLFSCKSALPNRFLYAIGITESGWNTNALGDYKHGKPQAIGVFQEHKAMFEDCQRLNPELRMYKWHDCKRLDVSILVLNTYLKNFCPEAYQKNNLEWMARTWNGGNRWRDHPEYTALYWSKVKYQLSIYK
jgi:hypothetical protein